MCVSCPLRKGSFEGHRCSVLYERGLGKRTDELRCGAAKITYLPVAGNELLSAGAHDPPLSAGKSLQKHGALLLWLARVVHNFMEMVCKKHLRSACAFFSGVLRGSWAAGTSTGLLQEGKILRLCLKSVREIEKSVRN